MAKKDEGPDAGEKALDDLTEGKAGLEAISDQQLEYLGGDRDSIDSEDFSEADRGDVLPEDFDDRSPALAQASKDKEDDDDDAEDKEGADADGEDDADKDADADADADADPEKDADADDADADGDADKDADGDPDDKGDADADEGEDADKSGEDADADTEGEGEGEGEDKDGRPREQQIPKSRFDKINKRRRDAEAELKALKDEKAAGEEAEAFDFDEAEKVYLDLALAGKTTKALEKRAEIRAAEKAAYSKETQVTATDATKDAQDDVALDVLVAKYETDYADMNPESETYSEDLMDEVTSMYVGYQTLGFERPEAFKMACDNVVKLYELESTAKGEPTTPKKKDEKKPTTKKKPIKKTKEKLAKAKDQPADPNAAGAGTGDDARRATNIEDMSDEELEALPAASLARLRGDTIQ